MNLTDYFNRFSIEGFRLQELNDILSHGNYESSAGTLFVKRTAHDLMPKSIKCVKEYWTKEEGGKKIKASGSTSLKCHIVRQALGLGNANQIDCAACHRTCLREHMNGGEISRIYNTSKKGRK